MSTAAPLTFAALRKANTERCNSAFNHKLGDWSLTDWACALAGEVGEAANLIKKLRRGDYGDIRFEPQHIAIKAGEDDATTPQLHEALADELADIACYLDLLAARAGIDLEAAIRRKFNIVSDRRGSPIKL